MKPVAKIELPSGPGGALNDRLLSLNVHDEAGHQNDRLTVVFDDRSPEIEFPPEGTEIKVSLGYEASANAGPSTLPPVTEVGTYVLTEVESAGDGSGQVLRISANAIDTNSPVKQSRTLSYHNKKLGEIIQEVADRNGLELRIDDDLKDIELKQVDQTAESDLAFVTRIGNRFGSSPKFVDNKILVFAKVGKLRSVGNTELPKVTLDKSSVLGHTYLKQSRGEASKVRAKSYDMDKAEEIKSTADSSEEGKAEIELAGTFPDETQAQEAADGKAKALKNQKETFSFTTLGDPGLLAEGVVELGEGWRSGIPRVWKIVSADQTYDSNGYTSSCQCELPSD